MKKASTIFYRLGQIFSIIFAIFYPLGLIAGIILIIVGVIQKAAPLGIFGGVLTAVFAFLLAMIIVVIILANKAVKSMKENAGKLAPHILLIIFGLLSLDDFYVIGGVLGAITTGKDKKALKEAPVEAEVEEVPEEPKAE